MPVDLRERLFAAADEPTLAPDTDAILRRASGRRRHAGVLRAGGIVLIIAAALVAIQVSVASDDADVVTKPVRQPGALEIDRTPNQIVVRLVDATADPAVLERELDAAGIEASVEAQPVVPSFVGDWVFEGSSSNALAVTVDSDDRSVIRFRLPLTDSYQLAYGQPALPNETFVTSTGAFLPGEALHCTGVEKLTPPEAEQAIKDLGFEVSWRLWTTTQVLPNGTVNGNSEVVVEPPDGLITGATQLSPTVMVVFVAPIGDPQASQNGLHDMQGAC